MKCNLQKARQLDTSELTSLFSQKKRVRVSLNYLGLSPCPVTVTTRIIVFLAGDPYKYKPSFATDTGRGDNPRYTHIYEFSSGTT